MTEKRWEEALRLYNLGLSQSQVAKKMGICKKSVWLHLQTAKRHQREVRKWEDIGM
jgi:predicted DNA-binding protein (UPF0251 family)